MEKPRGFNINFDFVGGGCYTWAMTETRWVVEVDLALGRPVSLDVTSTWVIMAPDAMTAELTAISCATQAWKAEMPLGSRIIDWEE